MRKRGIKEERLNLLLVAIYLGTAVLGARLMHMQVIRNLYYLRAAELNRTQIIHQTSPRGRIFDRNGEVIATSRPAFSLIYLPGKKKDSESLLRLADSLSKELRREKGDLVSLLQEAQKEGSAIRLAENLPLRPMFRLSELKTLYPGVDLVVEARRYYPKGAHSGHLLGYMGKMDKRSWGKLKLEGYRVDSWIGRSGLEDRFESVLRGVDGKIRMEINAQGSLKRKLGETPWTQGNNIHLTIDTRIQEAVEEGLRSSPSGTGAAVVMDPNTGAILAMASIPDFDPNLFLLPEWDEARQALKSFPGFNRAISGTYSPASTFKIIAGAAMLNEGKITPTDTVFCPGFFMLGHRRMGCWEKKGHKKMDWLSGITHSCDVFFYKMGLRVGGDLIENYAHKFHLGQKTGVVLKGEKSGNMFGPAARKLHKRGWYDGDTANLAIGQGELLVTPVQMAVVISAVANRGTLWRPHFTEKIVSPDGRVLHQQVPLVQGKVDLKPEIWDLLVEGLLNVIEHGTGMRVRIPTLTVAGKTGTAENSRGEDHAWFVAYAGKEGEAPTIAVSVLVEHGGHGGSAAGPVARRAIEAAFDIASARHVVPKSPVVQEGLPNAPESLPEVPVMPRPVRFVPPKPTTRDSDTPEPETEAPGASEEDIEPSMFPGLGE